MSGTKWEYRNVGGYYDLYRDKNHVATLYNAAAAFEVIRILKATEVPALSSAIRQAMEVGNE